MNNDRRLLKEGKATKDRPLSCLKHRAMRALSTLLLFIAAVSSLYSIAARLCAC